MNGGVPKTSEGQRPDVTWSQRLTKGQMSAALPYLAHVRSFGRNGDWLSSGSGLLVAPSHVLTCFHVVHLQSEESRNARSHELTPYDDQGWVEVTLGDGTEGASQAVQVAEHLYDDLILLKLPRPARWVRAPLDPIALGAGERPAWICGFQTRDDGHRFVAYQVALDPRMGKRSARGQEAGTHAHGAEGGASGGPVFTEENGLPVFLGIAELGGLGSARGDYVAADNVRAFLAENGIAIPPRAPVASDLERWCLINGCLPVLGSAWPEVVSDLQCLPAHSGHVPLYGSRRPIGAAIDPARARMAGAARMAAHVADPEALPGLLEEAARRSDLALRLPSGDEFAHMCRVAAAPARIVGRPATLEDYDSPDGLRASPNACAEWVGDGGPPYLCLFRNGEIRRFSEFAHIAAEFDGVRAVVRPVFNTQG